MQDSSNYQVAQESVSMGFTCLDARRNARRKSSRDPNVCSIQRRGGALISHTRFQNETQELTVDVPAANGIAVKYAISVSLSSGDGPTSHNSADMHGRDGPASIFVFTFLNSFV